MTWRDEIDMEIRRQAIRLYPDCAALFELPRRVYAQIMQDNSMRRKPYRVSEVKIRISVRGWSATCIKEFPLRSSSK